MRGATSSFYYDRFSDNNASSEGQFFAALLSGSSKYREVAKLEYAALPLSWLDPEPEFFNPKIYVFQRADTLGLGPSPRPCRNDGQRSPSGLRAAVVMGAPIRRRL